MAQRADGRVVFADLLRIFATLAVIFLHIAGSHMADVGVDTGTWAVLNLYDALVRWCVPVFVMLSGMFLLDPRQDRSLGRLFLHNGLHILLALLFWGGVYAVADCLQAGSGFSWESIWPAVRNALRGNTHYHLWYLYMILGLYLVTPVLRAFVRGAGRGELLYFLGVCFLFASVLPTAFQLWPDATADIQTWYYRLDLKLVLGYVGFYVGGYYLREYTISRLAEACIYVLGILGAVATVWGTSVLSRRTGSLYSALYGYTSPNVVFFSVAVVVLFRYVLGVSDERSRRQRVSGLARLTFGVYLVHDLFIMLFNELGITTLSFPAVAAVPGLTAAVFVCALGTAWGIRQIPVAGRWLI